MNDPDFGVRFRGQGKVIRRLEWMAVAVFEREGWRTACPSAP